jgi:predicted ATPase
MHVAELTVRRYRCLRDVKIELGSLNVFIGPNGSGKSTILDVSRFLNEGLTARSFKEAVDSRVGIVHLAWKGEDASRIEVSITIVDGSQTVRWTVELVRSNYEFQVRESVKIEGSGSPPQEILHSDEGSGW